MKSAKTAKFRKIGNKLGNDVKREQKSQNYVKIKQNLRNDIKSKPKVIQNQNFIKMQTKVSKRNFNFIEKFSQFDKKNSFHLNEKLIEKKFKK